MNRAPPTPDGRDEAPDPTGRTKERTPQPDVQADDAGTAESGNAGGSPTQPAMKQTAKTDTEAGSPR